MSVNLLLTCRFIYLSEYAKGGWFPPWSSLEHPELVCSPVVLVVTLEERVEPPPIVDVLRRRVLEQELEENCGKKFTNVKWFWQQFLAKRSFLEISLPGTFCCWSPCSWSWLQTWDPLWWQTQPSGWWGIAGWGQVLSHSTKHFFGSFKI